MARWLLLSCAVLLIACSTVQATSRNLTRCLDTDLDGVCDRDEVADFLDNPRNVDGDGDGVPDIKEWGR